MKKWKGIGCFIEDFIEQAHQFGSKDELRTMNMADKVIAAHSHAAWEQMAMNCGVQNAKKEVQQRTKRKRKATSTNVFSAGELKKMKREQL